MRGQKIYGGGGGKKITYVATISVLSLSPPVWFSPRHLDTFESSLLRLQPTYSELQIRQEGEKPQNRERSICCYYVEAVGKSSEFNRFLDKRLI